MRSSRYMCATTVPEAHSSSVLHSTLSPIAKRSASTLLLKFSGVARHALNLSANSFGSRFLPMKTSLDTRSSPSAHLSPQSPLKIICTPWYTNLRAAPSSARIPFMRKMSTPLSRSVVLIHSSTAVRSTCPRSVKATLVTEASCSCVLSVSRKPSSISSVRCRSKAPRSSTESTPTFDCWQCWMGAKALISRSRFSTRTRSASLARSTLFSRMRSAKATCSTASFSAPSGFSSSRCCSTCFASTRVTMPSRRNCSLMVSSTKKVCATGAGSAIPVVSMTTASMFSFLQAILSESRLSTTTRSCRTVQQMHPFIISMTSSPSA
mmetsp:Transcript_18298/g.30547  ORF Transcript_18298/g.30547 Transcript_18298/m.30547 type:complete len:322 (-) Transcript_18298:274-1239(-)